MVADKKLEFVERLTFTRYFKATEEEVTDKRFLPCEVGTYIYRAIW